MLYLKLRYFFPFLLMITKMNLLQFDTKSLSDKTSIYHIPFTYYTPYFCKNSNFLRTMIIYVFFVSESCIQFTFTNSCIQVAYKVLFFFDVTKRLNERNEPLNEQNGARTTTERPGTK